MHCLLSPHQQCSNHYRGPQAPGQVHSSLQRASSCCLPSTLHGILPSLLSLELQVGMAWVIWNHAISLVWLILGTWCLPRSFLDFKVTLSFFFFFCFRECKHDFTLPATAGSSFCYSILSALAGSTPVHLWGPPGPFPGQLDLPRAYMPSAERMQASVSRCCQTPTCTLHSKSPSPALSSAREWKGGADCQGNHWRRRDSS